MTLWLLMAALLLAVAGLATRPWWLRGGTDTLKRRGANIAAYRTRLAELEAEGEAGLVPAGEAGALKAELDARLVAEAQAEDPATALSGRRWRAVILSTLVLAVFSGGWYYFAGSWQAQQQLSTAVAQAEQVNGMVDTLAERLRQNPDDPQGWALLGRSYFVMQRYDDAAKAYGEANARSPQPEADWLAGQGEALGFARDRDLQGVPAQLFDRALAVDPDFGKALWYGGLAAAQAGDAATARARWSKLLTEQDLPPQMRESLQNHLQELEAAAGAPAGAGRFAGAGGAERGRARRAGRGTAPADRSPWRPAHAAADAVPVLRRAGTAAVRAQLYRRRKRAALILHPQSPSKPGGHAMTVEKFLRRSQIISEHLKQLAGRSEQMQWDGIMHPVNPEFRDVLQAQERLLNALERLADGMVTRVAA